MKHIYWILCLIPLTSCKPSEKSPVDSSASAQSDANFRGMPSRSDLPELKKSAMEGSGLAARQLALWHMKAPEDENTYVYWVRIGAENGDSVSQYNLAVSYREGEVTRDKILAAARYKYWLKKAADQGDKRAQELQSE